MPANYLALVANRIKELAAVVVSAGAGDADKLVSTDPSGKIDISLMPAGIGANTVAVEASEGLAAGDLVNFWDDSGTIKVRKADATTEGKEAHGFTKAAFSSSATATVYLTGNVISGLSGLTPAARYFLHTTAGLATLTPPTATGSVWQPVGIASSATEIVFEPEEPITRA